MKVGYFDCFSGAAGDMIVAACLDAGAPEPHLLAELDKLKLPNLRIKIEKVHKKGISATAFTPEPDASGDHHHSHGHQQRNLPTIIELINSSSLSATVQQNAVRIFERLAQAEADVHGTTPDRIHFHEVGALDSIVDIVGACIAIESLHLERIYCSAMALGSGTVRCEHGILPVPAPATSELIKGIPIQPSQGDGELLTPTGAAILTTLAAAFGPMPRMRITQIGYGAGSRETPGHPNALRLFLGQAEPAPHPDTGGDLGPSTDHDEVFLLEANLDDCTAELTGHVADVLLGLGALDVFFTSITMKKGRPGTKISVLCPPEQLSRLENAMFMESTTFGIRRQLVQRSVLSRRSETVETDFGPIRVKVGLLGGEVVTASPEFEDCRLAGQKHGVAVKKVMAAAVSAYEGGR